MCTHFSRVFKGKEHLAIPIKLMSYRIPIDIARVFRDRLLIRVTPFLTFCYKVLLPAFFLMQFYALISNIPSVFQNSGKNCHSRPFESQFWPISTVFVILCGVQSPRCSSHLIRANCYLFICFILVYQSYFSVI